MTDAIRSALLMTLGVAGIFALGNYIGLPTAISLAVAALYVRSGYMSRVRARAADVTPTARIAVARDDFVELRGRAQCFEGRSLRDPILDRTCVWFAIRSFKGQVEFVGPRRDPMAALGINFRKRRLAAPFMEATSTRPFLLVDSTGACLVNPSGAAFELAPPERFYDRESNTTHAIWRIQADTPISLWGDFHRLAAAKQANAVHGRIAKRSRLKPFLLSTSSPQEVALGAAARSRIYFAIAIAALIMAGLFFIVETA